MSTKRTPPAAWFRDPTVDTAMHNETLREREKERQKRNTIPTKPQNLVYIASPYRGDVARNIANAICYSKYAVSQGKMPIAPHIWLPQFLDDRNVNQRQTALNFGLWLLGQCSEI
jgi:hypothetical protein